MKDSIQNSQWTMEPFHIEIFEGREGGGRGTFNKLHVSATEKNSGGVGGGNVPQLGRAHWGLLFKKPYNRLGRGALLCP